MIFKELNVREADVDVPIATIEDDSHIWTVLTKMGGFLLTEELEVNNQITGDERKSLNKLIADSQMAESMNGQDEQILKNSKSKSA